METQEKINYNQDEVEIDLKELFGAIWSHIRFVIVCTVLLAVLAAGYTKLFITPVYKASSQIYVFNQTNNATSLSDLQVGSQLAYDFQILGTTRPVVERVIQQLNLNTTYEKLVRAISVQNIDKSRILKITVASTSPQMAADISNAMAESLSNRIAEVMVTDAPSIVEKALVPRLPAAPSTKKNTVLGAALGLLISVGVVVVRFLMDDTIKTSSDVEKYLHINTLASIPREFEMEEGNRKKKGFGKKKRTAQKKANRRISTQHKRRN